MFVKDDIRPKRKVSLEATEVELRGEGKERSDEWKG